ncbi:adenylate/guanylate cyclase domain-containing protein [Bacillota bacterium]
MVITLKKWSLIIHVSIILIFALLMFFNAFETMDKRLQDALYQKQLPIGAEVVIVGIDDDSLGALGKWPWPRDYHGELIRLISEGEPSVIGYDIILSEDSSEEGADDYLLQMAGNAGNVIFPTYGSFASSAKKGILEPIDMARPFSALAAVTGSGHINTMMDNDGIVRKTILYFEYEGEKIQSFAWEIYKQYEADSGKAELEMDAIPLDPWKRMSIRFSGEPRSFEIVPFFSVLSGDIPGEYFRDKIVLVGPTAIGLADDYYFTPMAPHTPMYGVEIHANIINQLLAQKFWKEVPFGVQLMIMLALWVGAYFCFRRFKPWIGASTFFIIAVLFLAAAKIVSSSGSGYIFSFAYPLILIALQYVAALGEKFISEQLEKKRVTAVFGKYVAPQIVDKILEEGEAGLQLGGSRRDITVLFVDIRGFTPLSEAAEPEEVVSILNDYLTLCAESIFAYGGTLDKYIGDATMALFNAPLDLGNHQLRAVQTAWAMHLGAIPLQKKLEEKFGKTVRFGVGIHTGSAIVGNIGAAFRMDYTAIGDTVNTASRIESNSKPGQILISQEVYDHVKDYVEVTDIGPIQVKGKSKELQIYQIDNIREITI